MSDARIALVAPFPPPLAGMSHQANILGNYLTEEGITVHRVRTNNYRGVPPLRDVSAWLQFRGICRGVDAVNVHTCCYTSYFGTSAPIIWWTKKLGKRLVVTYKHGAAREVFTRTGEFGLRWLRMADVVTVQSGFLRDVFSDFGLETRIVHNVFETQLEPSPPRRLHTDAPRIIMTRGLGHYYNPLCTVKAFQRVLERYPNAQLLIAGEGSLEVPTRQYISREHVPNVQLLGQISRDRIHELYRSADILINSSHIDNFPGALLEAFLFGVPIASTDPGGIPYMVKHGESARLVAVGDHGARRREVLWLLDHPDEARRYAETAQRSIQDYRWDSVREDWFDVLGVRPPERKQA